MRETLDGVSFQIEPLFSCLAEMEPLLAAHWAEIANPDIPLDINIDRYHSLEREGILRIYTMRVGSDRLIGYAAYFVGPHIHYKSTIYAQCDVFYVSPESRGRGRAWRLLEFAEADLGVSGAMVATYHGKVAHPEFQRLLEARGAKHTENIHEVQLNG
jgi:GNAT superfamily N-acetyltransferase